MIPFEIKNNELCIKDVFIAAHLVLAGGEIKKIDIQGLDVTLKFIVRPIVGEELITDNVHDVTDYVKNKGYGFAGIQVPLQQPTLMYVIRGNMELFKDIINKIYAGVPIPENICNKQELLAKITELKNSAAETIMYFYSNLDKYQEIKFLPGVAKE